MSTRLEKVDGPLDTSGQPDEAPPTDEHGFLPIRTNGFDRLFIGVVIWIAVSLFWLRFVEPAGPSIWIANVACVALGAFVIAKG